MAKIILSQRCGFTAACLPTAIAIRGVSNDKEVDTPTAPTFGPSAAASKPQTAAEMEADRRTDHILNAFRTGKTGLQTTKSQMMIPRNEMRWTSQIKKMEDTASRLSAPCSMMMEQRKVPRRSETHPTRKSAELTLRSSLQIRTTNATTHYETKYLSTGPSPGDGKMTSAMVIGISNFRCPDRERVDAWGRTIEETGAVSTMLQC